MRGKFSINVYIDAGDIIGERKDMDRFIRFSFNSKKSYPLIFLNPKAEHPPNYLR